MLRGLLGTALFLAPLGMTLAADLPAVWQETELRRQVEQMGRGIAERPPEEVREYVRRLERLRQSPTLSEAGYRALVGEYLHLQSLPNLPPPTLMSEARGEVNLRTVRGELESFLQMRSQEGRVPPSILDWVNERDRGAVAQAMAVAPNNERRNLHLLRLIEATPIAPASEVRSVLQQASFRTVADLFRALNLHPESDGALIERLRRFVADPAHPDRALALVAGKPDAFRRYGIALGPEFLPPFVEGAREEALQRYRFDLEITAGADESEKKVVRAAIRNETQQAYRHAFGETVRETLHAGAQGPIRPEQVKPLLNAIQLANTTLAQEYARDQQKIYVPSLLKLARAGLPEAAEALADVRQQSLLALAAVETPEVRALLIDTLDDPQVLNRMAAALQISQHRWEEAESARVRERLAALEAQGVDLRAHLRLNESELGSLRRHLLASVHAGAGVPAPGCESRYRAPQLRVVR